MSTDPDPRIEAAAKMFYADNRSQWDSPEFEWLHPDMQDRYRAVVAKVIATADAAAVRVAAPLGDNPAQMTVETGDIGAISTPLDIEHTEGGMVMRPRHTIPVKSGETFTLSYPVGDSPQPADPASLLRELTELHEIGVYRTAVIRAGVDEIDRLRAELVRLRADNEALTNAAELQRWTNAHNMAALRADLVRYEQDPATRPTVASWNAIVAERDQLRADNAAAETAVANVRELTAHMATSPAENVRAWASDLGAALAGGGTEPAPAEHADLPKADWLRTNDTAEQMCLALHKNEHGMDVICIRPIGHGVQPDVNSAAGNATETASDFTAAGRASAG